MLQIKVPGVEFYDEIKNEFLELGEETLILEHSLISVSKWESKYHKSFLEHPEHTRDEMLDYIRCMTLNKVSDYVYDRLTNEHFVLIKNYIEDRMSATYLRSIGSESGTRDKITSELIYYWMVTLQIPFECEKWHLNRLFALIKVCSVKNGSGKKMSKGDIMRQNNAINAARRKKFNTKG